jgi:hypothetical protein
MSLDRFRRTRMVVLAQQATAHQAARAMADDHIGPVLVSQARGLRDIVTGRALALAVLGGGLDAKTTLLGEVMSEGVVACDIAADLAAGSDRRGSGTAPGGDESAFPCQGEWSPALHANLAPSAGCPDARASGSAAMRLAPARSGRSLCASVGRPQATLRADLIPRVWRDTCLAV